MVSPKVFTLVQKGIVALPIETDWTAAAGNPRKPITMAWDFSGFKQTVLSGPDIQAAFIRRIHSSRLHGSSLR
jgi:hypothetical protein